MPLMQNNSALQYFQHDNARPHAAIPTQLYLDNAQVKVLKWQAKSPDMSPIEDIWEELGQRVYVYNVTSKAELEDVLIAEYNDIPQQFIRTLTNSKRQRVRALIHARATRY